MSNLSTIREAILEIIFSSRLLILKRSVYKDDDKMTKKTEGIQQFKLITNCRKKFKDRSYETSCYISNNLRKIFEIAKLPNRKELTEFKELPDNYFPDKKVQM